MESKETTIKNIALASLVALVAVAAFVLIKGWMGGHFSSADSLRTYVASYGIWAPVVLALIQMLLTLLPICTSFTGCVVGAGLFGTVGGFLTNYIGICAGSILSYALAKRYGIQLVSKMVAMEKYEAYIEKINRSKSYPKLLFAAILLPMAPDNFLCYFSGLVNMPAKQFIPIIIASKPWCILLYSVFFAYVL